MRFRTLLPALVFGLMFGYFANAEVIERIVAIVNDDIITLSDVNKYYDRLKSGGLTDDLLIPDEETKANLMKDRDKLLQTMIDEKIIDSEVKRQNLQVPIERVAQEVMSIAKRNNISRDELKQTLQERGLSFSQYQDFIKTGLERQQLIEKAVTSKIKVSEDDVNSVYLATVKGAEDQRFEYTIAQIMIVPDKNKETKTALALARTRAETVLAKLKGGGSFEKLASENSDDPNFSSGGVLGAFRSGELVKDFEGVVQKLGVSENSNIIQTKSGFYILKLLKKKPVSDPAADKDKEKIRAQLYEKAYKKQFQSWLEQLRQDAFIRINQKSEKAS